jgi:uncharacterized protein involved in outer membrane biogenesis
MKLGTVFKIIGVLLVAIVVGGMVVLLTLDLNEYKPEIIAKVKQMTGRDLIIDGDIKLEISLSPAIAVNGVRFANAAWGSRRDMVKIDRFEAQVALLPLLSGVIDVQKIVLVGADILLEKNAAGVANFVFTQGGKSAPSSAGDAGDAGDAGEEGGGPVIPVVRHVSIENAVVTYKDAASGQTISLSIDTLSLRGDGADRPLTLLFKGSFNDNPIAASGTLGAPATMLAGDKPFALDLAIEAGGAKITLNGSIADSVAARGVDVAIALEGQTLAALSALAGAPLPPLGPYSVKGRVRGDAGKVLTLSGLAVKIGGSDLGGTIRVALGGTVPVIDAVLTSKRLDLADFIKPAARAGTDAKGAATPVPAPGEDGRVFPDDPLPLEGLKALDATVKISIGSLIAAVEATKVEIGLALKGGDLKIAPLRAVIADGTLDGSARLNGARATPTLDAELKILKFDLGKALADMAVTDLFEGRINIVVDLKGRGVSVRQFMAGLNGRTQIAMGAGRMKNTALDTLIGGPAKFLTETFVGKRSEYTVINCMVSQFDIVNGLATSKAMLFDTDYVTIAGTGTVNLASEAIKLDIDPRSKSATVSAAVPVEIRGTLGKPEFGANKLAAARKVAGILGGIAFPPALIVGLVDTGTGEPTPCAGGGKKAVQKTAPATSTDPVSGALKRIEKGLGGALKGLFGR